MLQSAEFWVLVATVVFVVVAFKPIRQNLVAMLDQRAERIRAELEEAQRLREEAQTLLATCQRRQREALKEAEDIIAHAREEAERIRRQAAADLEHLIQRREQQAMDKIAQAETQAMQEVRAVTVDIAVAAAHRILAERLDGARAERLVEAAIAELPRHLH